MKFLQSDLTLNLLLPPVVTYWHDHVQVSNLRTPSLLRFTATKVPTLVTLRSHSKVSNHLQLLIFVATTRFYQCLIVGIHLDTVENWKVKLKTEKYCSKIIFKVWIVPWDQFLMKKLLKSEICGSMNNAWCALIG